MKRKNSYDPVHEMYDALASGDITLEFAFMLFGAEREAVRIMKHGMSDGFLELYEDIGPVRRYLDVWELDELVRDLVADERGVANKIKQIFVAVTKKGLTREK